MSAKHAILLFFIAWAFLLVLVFMATNAKAHNAPSGWRYPSNCCSDTAQECDPIPAEKAHQKADGNWEVILNKADHKNVPMDGFKYTVTPAQLRPSGDGEYHACIRTNGMQMDCLIIPLSM